MPGDGGRGGAPARAYSPWELERREGRGKASALASSPWELEGVRRAGPAPTPAPAPAPARVTGLCMLTKRRPLALPIREKAPSVWDDRGRTCDTTGITPLKDAAEHCRHIRVFQDLDKRVVCSAGDGLIEKCRLRHGRGCVEGSSAYAHIRAQRLIRWVGISRAHSPEQRCRTLRTGICQCPRAASRQRRVYSNFRPPGIPCTEPRGPGKGGCRSSRR